MKAQRRQAMKEYILEQGNVSLKYLEENFDVSMNTVRRDIAEIIKDPRFKKVYGGISVDEKKVVPFLNRNIEKKNEKRQIGREAAQYIEEDDFVFIDSGTTTRYILDYLPQKRRATIITNNLDVINQVDRFENLSLIVVGAQYKRETRSFVGLREKEIFDRYNVNKAFMAATGVSIEKGLMNSDILEFEIKKHFVDKATEVYLLADSRKFSESTFLTYTDLSNVGKIFTDEPLPEEYQDFCRSNQIDVYETKREENEDALS